VGLLFGSEPGRDNSYKLLVEASAVREPFLALPAIALVSFGAALGQEDAAKKELGKMKGGWQLVRGEEGGEPVSEYVVKNLEMVVKGDQLTFNNIAPLTDKASTLTIKLDPSTTPRCIDLKVEAGSLKGTVLEGVYEVKADELKLCLHFAGGTRNRPLEFETRSGSNRVLLVLKRQGP
jgi:uncharacterized protein (TIGR03067 family)